jgi:hypothetical protein
MSICFCYQRATSRYHWRTFRWPCSSSPPHPRDHPMQVNNWCRFVFSYCFHARGFSRATRAQKTLAGASALKDIHIINKHSETKPVCHGLLKLQCLHDERYFQLNLFVSNCNYFLDAQLPQFLECINSEKVVHHRPSSALSFGLKVWEWSSPKQVVNMTYTHKMRLSLFSSAQVSTERTR